MATYNQLCGGGAELNTIVMAGSHDAGITRGGGNARTQNLNIYQQAKAGVRLFDLRIAVSKATGTTGGDKNAEMRAYHADGAAKTQATKTRYLAEIGQSVSIERSKIRAGTFGESLSKMLADAHQFVTEESTEFLILKFDKCYNWLQIAQACIGLLGTKLYTGGGNLNRKTLDELAGKVIAVFTKDGLEAITLPFATANGIYGIKNCNGGGGYDANYAGLQYFGKGGTSIMGIRPIRENRKKQAGLMRAGIQSDPQVMGMMYWTSTGLIGNIKSRNKKMWTRTNSMSLQQTWEHGLGESIKERLKPGLPDTGGAVLKTFMPNIVMIDFADAAKCEAIMGLNKVAGQQLMQLVRDDASYDSEG